MADELLIKYTGTSGALADGGTTFVKGELVSADADHAEKLLAFEGEHTFEEASDEEYARAEQASKDAEAATAGAKEIEAANAEEAKRRAAYYGAQSQDEIDEAFQDESTPDEVAPSDEQPPEDVPVSEDSEDEADSFRESFDYPGEDS